MQAQIAGESYLMKLSSHAMADAKSNQELSLAVSKRTFHVPISGAIAAEKYAKSLKKERESVLDKLVKYILMPKRLMPVQRRPSKRRIRHGSRL